MIVFLTLVLAELSTNHVAAVSLSVWPKVMWPAWLANMIKPRPEKGTIINLISDLNELR